MDLQGPWSEHSDLKVAFVSGAQKDQGPPDRKVISSNLLTACEWQYINNVLFLCGQVPFASMAGTVGTLVMTILEHNVEDFVFMISTQRLMSGTDGDAYEPSDDRFSNSSG